MIAQQENSWSQFYTNVDVYLLASGHLIMYFKICFDVLAKTITFTYFVGHNMHSRATRMYPEYHICGYFNVYSKMQWTDGDQLF